MSLFRALERFALLALLIMLVSVAGCGEKSDSGDAEATRPAADNDAISPTASRSGTTDVSYIPPNCLAGALFRFRDVLALETMKWMPIEVAEAFSKQRLGIDIHDIDEVVALVDAPDFASGQPPEFGGIVRFSRAYDLSGLFQGVPLPLERTTLPNGKPALSFRDGGITVLLTMPDDKTLLVGTPAMVDQMARHKLADTSSVFVSQFQALSSSFQVAALVNVQAIPEDAMQELQEEIGRMWLPDWATGLAQQAMQLQTIDLGLDLTSGMSGQLTLRTDSNAAALRLEESIRGSLVFYRQLVITQAKSLQTGDPVIDEALGRYVDRVTGELVEAVKPTVENDVVVFNSEAAVGMAGVGAMAALLLPAVSQARGAARTMSSQNNLKQIGLAIRTYHEIYGRFPVGESPGMKYKDGKPLHSWRVYLLPFVEQEPLYRQFHLDEPWDSPHNIQFADRVISVYTNPRANLEPGYTNYVAPQGPNTVLGSNRMMRYRDITDGESQVILVMEVGPENAIPWSQPDNLEIDADDVIGSILPEHDDFQALMCDGSVQRFSVAVMVSEVFMRLIQRNDGEPIPEHVFYGVFGDVKTMSIGELPAGEEMAIETIIEVPEAAAPPPPDEPDEAPDEP
jgi:hypothetical protein